MTDKTLGSDFIAWSYGLFGFRPGQDDLDRVVYATEYNGAYGKAGVIMTVDGTPPRATVILQHASHDMIAFVPGGRVVKGQRDGFGGKAQRNRYVEAVNMARRFGFTIGD